MKVELIQPPANGLSDQKAYPPLGLMYLASNLANFNPQNRDVEKAIKIICNENEYKNIDGNADVYGINIHAISTFQSSLHLIDYLASINPTAKIVVGGAFVNQYTQKLFHRLSENKIDFYIYGEGESVFSDLVYSLKVDSNNDKQILSAKSQIQNLDELLFPERDLLPDDVIKHEGKVHHNDQPATTILASRGCPYNCGFCDRNMWGRGIRYRSVENVIDEIEEIVSEYSIKWFRFPDDNLFVRKEWVNEFCRKIEQHNILFTALASPKDMLDDNLLENIAKSGCKEIFLGIESGSDWMLTKMKKQTTNEINKQAINNLKKHGIKSCAYLIFGFPGEHEFTVNETIRFLEEAKPNKARLSTFVPFPGLDIWQNPEKHGIKLDYNYFNYWYFDVDKIPYSYNYITNDGLTKLQDKLKSKMKGMGYLDGWTK